MIGKKDIFNSLPSHDATNEKINSWVLMGNPFYGSNLGLDPRKGFLVQEDFLNVMGTKEHKKGDGRDIFEITEDGDIEVAGNPIEKLNEEMVAKKATITPTTSAIKELGEQGVKNIAESDHVNVINPEPVYSISNHKGDQHHLFDQSPANIPFFVHSSMYSEIASGMGKDEEIAVDRLIDDFEREMGYEGPIICKEDSEGMGNGIEIKSSPIELAEDWLNEGIPDDQVIQMKLDELYDARWIIGGDITGEGEIITGERRYGDPDVDLCNLSQISTSKENDTGAKIVRGLEEGLVEPASPENINDKERELIEDVYDTVMNYVEENFGWSDSYREHFRGSIDIIVFDPNDQDHIPDQIVDELMEYSTERGYGLIPIEWNNQSGSMVDAVNIDNPSQDSAANLTKQMYQISAGEEYSKRGLPQNMAIDDMIPNGGLGEERHSNRFFGLFRDSEYSGMSAEELYMKVKEAGTDKRQPI